MCGSNRWTMLNLENSESVQSIPRAQNYTDMLTQEACYCSSVPCMCAHVCVCTCMLRPGEDMESFAVFPTTLHLMLRRDLSLNLHFSLGLTAMTFQDLLLVFNNIFRKTSYIIYIFLYMLYCLRYFYDCRVPGLLKGK